MSLISNASSRVGDSFVVHAVGQFFNTPTKKTVIVLLAVVVIIALGVYLLRAGDCLRRIRATTLTPPPPSPDPSPSSVTAASEDALLLKIPPREVFEHGERLRMTHYKRSDSLAGWVLIRATEEGSIEVRVLSLYDPMIFASFRVDEEALSLEVPNLDGCISAQEVASSLAEQARVEAASLFLMPDTRASLVPESVFQEGERLGATHYLHKGVKSSFYKSSFFREANGYLCSDWIIINDRELTSYFLPSEDDQTLTVYPYPTDTTGSITAEEVRACRPTGNFSEDRYNETNIPPEFILRFGEEHGATHYKYQRRLDVWHVFCGEKSYSLKRNGTFAPIPGRENPPQATDWPEWDRVNFFTAEQVRAHYELVRPRQPENRSAIASTVPNTSSERLIPLTTIHVPETVASFGQRCKATHYEIAGNEWVIYCGESQSYVYSHRSNISRPGLSQEALNEKLESDPSKVFTAEQVRNDQKVRGALIFEY